MADYNVNMKQWNGTSFDNVLPLAYNSNLLNGSSLFDIQQYVKNNGLLLFTGTYLGNGSESMKSVTFPFIPKIFIFPQAANILYSDNTSCVPITTNILSTEPATFYVDRSYSSPYRISIWKSNNEKTIYWEPVGGGVLPFNVSGLTYGFAAIGGYDMGGATEWVIDSSGTYTVPKTGRYMLELYGGGGGTPRALSSNGYTGGSSCQHYDSVSLNAGNTIQVVIGAAGKSSSGATSGGSTSLGSYTVLGGGAASDSAAGGAAGNYGKSGVRVSRNSNVQTYNDGVFGTMYGVGSSNSSNANGATAGAVYLKYLGA